MVGLPIDIKNWIRPLLTLEEMLEDRGYTKVRIIGTGTELLLFVMAVDAKNDNVCVYITEENKVGVKTLRRIKEEALRLKCSLAILLCPNGLTPFATKELASTEEEPLRCEIFRKSELTFNITHHHLVPKHRAMTNIEKKKIMSTMNCKLNSFPKIKETDPIIKYLGLVSGSMVEISRVLGSMETEIYYRTVVA